MAKENVAFFELSHMKELIVDGAEDEGKGRFVVLRIPEGGEGGMEEGWGHGGMDKSKEMSYLITWISRK